MKHNHSLPSETDPQWPGNAASAQDVTQPRKTSRFMEILTIPWVDKTIAIIAVVPNAIGLYHRYTSANLNFPRAVLGIQIFILIITMIFRRTPVRVTPNPWFWLLTFVATYGILAFTTFAQKGVRAAPLVVIDI